MIVTFLTHILNIPEIKKLKKSKMDPVKIEEFENDPNNWQEASADNGLKYFFNIKVIIKKWIC